MDSFKDIKMVGEQPKLILVKLTRDKRMERQFIVTIKKNVILAYLWSIKMYSAHHWSFVLYDVIFLLSL